MKRAFAVLFLSASLSGCAGGTPACGDAETLELIDEAIAEKADDLEAGSGKEVFGEIANDYEILNVRGNAYDREVDSYQCDARITYRYNGNELSVDFQYRVDTDQATGETLVEYERKMLSPIAVLAVGN